VSDWDRLSEWASLLDDFRLACLVEIAAVLAADQIGARSQPVIAWSSLNFSAGVIQPSDSRGRSFGSAAI
jgi:hypothetical protein